MTSQNEAGLQAELSRASATLDGHARSLHTIDAELEELSAERHQYRLLEEICGALGELDELGAARLFWGDHESRDAADAQLRVARGRVRAFEKRSAAAEGPLRFVSDGSAWWGATGVYALSGSIVAIPSGWLTEQLGYASYFALTAAMALPAKLKRSVARFGVAGQHGRAQNAGDQ